MNGSNENHDNFEDFIKTAGATMAGAYIGHKIDQTRFGVWFNNNATINVLWKLAGLLITGYFAYCFVVFLYYLVVA
jgi:hypothetical protein